MPDINGVLLQYFHWYIPDDGNLWAEAETRARELAGAGFTALWLPPAGKGAGGKSDVGYGVYDPYDLGEFYQKGTLRTKYGAKEQYLSAVREAREAGLQVYADAVLNHRMGGDEAETCRAVPYPCSDRKNPKGGARDIRCYTRFTFPGRQGAYSDFRFDCSHFDAVDYDANTPDDRSTVYLLEGKQFDSEVSLEFGGYAYLMGCDLDFQNPQVREETVRWGKWHLDATGVDGFRLDAIKHISAGFFSEWHDELERHAGKELFLVGEYWSASLPTLLWYLDFVAGRMSVFDVPLHFNFHQAGREGSGYDLRRIFDGTVAQARPANCVTFVDNHDSQPLQALESVVEPWFKPLAYALILLRREGYPCVFYPDYYGAEYEDFGPDGNRHRIVLPSHRFLLDRFLHARRHHAYGEQIDYFDHPNTVGWTRLGDEAHPKALAVLLGNGGDGWKWMNAGRPHATFIDITGHIEDPVTANEHGWGQFRCRGGSVSVWTQE